MSTSNSLEQAQAQLAREQASSHPNELVIKVCNMFIQRFERDLARQKRYGSRPMTYIERTIPNGDRD